MQSRRSIQFSHFAHIERLLNSGQKTCNIWSCILSSLGIYFELRLKTLFSRVFECRRMPKSFKQYFQTVSNLGLWHRSQPRKLRGWVGSDFKKIRNFLWCPACQDHTCSLLSDLYAPFMIKNHKCAGGLNSKL